MAKGFDVLHVKSAVKARNKIDLNYDALATMNFGEIIPLAAIETIPGDDMKINGNFYSRMAPLVKPTYGKFSFRTLSGFVPYHQIADDADAWLAGQTSWEGESTHQRWISVFQFTNYVKNILVTSGTADNADFIYKNASGVITYTKFTKFGKYVMKVLNALGYSLPESANFQENSTWLTWAQSPQARMSAYPILAFFKLYNDYMSQSQRYNTSQLTTLLKAIKHGKTGTGYIPGTGELTASALDAMFKNLYLQYENDYFTSAWQNANAPLSSDETMLTAADVPASDNYVTRLYDDNKLLVEGGENFSQLGQRALDFLKSFDDWVRRNHYSGSRSVQRVYSRFGIKVDDYRSNYAHILGTDIMPIQVGDVTATADAAGVPLGEYAGKGIMSGNKGVAYKADDFGMLFMFGWFTVVPMNAYGCDRKVLRNTPLDYYNPEFDGIGAEAISAAEFYSSPIVNPDEDLSNDKDVYGFTERYNSYRYGRDIIIGEFRNYRNNADMNVWHTGRLLTDVRKSGNLIAQSASINNLAQTDSEYNRIFSTTDGNEDKFYLTVQFNVDAIRPMLNLNQVVRLGEGSTAVPRNGNVVD